MKKIVGIIIVGLLVIACSNDKKVKKEGTSEKGVVKEIVFDDSEYVLDASYPMGDARRYGVTADDARKSHPTSGKNRMTTALDIAEMSGMEISFPSGYYQMDLTLNYRQNLKLRFNNSEFSLIHITRKYDSLPRPQNIEIKGTVIAYARLGLTKAKNISFDTVLLKTDINKNLYKMRNTGCHIYAGCEDITINYLEIDDMGSGSEKYKYSHAALAIDGWNNNPKDVTINKVYIKSTDRHGIYMTGNGNYIKEVVIDKFGMGTSDFMSGMGDAAKGEEKDFTAVWLNKCDFCAIDKITINEKESKGKYTVFLDSGDKQNPSIIEELIILNDNPSITIKRDPNTNVSVRE